MALDYSLRMLRNRRLRGRAEPPFPAPFVVGVGRSGTTLLRLMLDAHPELAIPPETHFLNPLIQASGRLRFNPKRGRADDRATTSAGAGTTSGSTRRSCSTRFQAHQAVQHHRRACAASTSSTPPSTASTRWGDKTPDYIRKMKKLQKHAARGALHPRDPRRPRRRAVAERADRQARARTRCRAREMARRWRKRIVKARVDAEELEHYIEVRYEDLITDTEGGPAPGLRAHRARLRPGDAALLRARRGAAAGDGRGPAGEEGPPRARGGRADRRARADHASRRRPTGSRSGRRR